ncbi:hypothetical protein ACFC08_03565 [Streptomyces sp. NPDC056112]|uniref:hypothetical protein n=1 Tax=Streptomyces sp. NPDC056112 TaxID=3345715 RepID=UPI0035D59F19
MAVPVDRVGDAAVPVDAQEHGTDRLVAVLDQALAPRADRADGAGGRVGAVGHAERTLMVDLRSPDLDGQALLDLLEVGPVQQPQFKTAGGEGEAQQQDNEDPGDRAAFVGQPPFTRPPWNLRQTSRQAATRRCFPAIHRHDG